MVREIRAQNVQAAAGVVGASPAVPGLDYQLSINAQGRLQSEEEFGDIIVKTGANGEVTRLRDIARIELGAAEYALRSLLDNKDAVAIGIFQAPGSNALAISDGVRAAMAELKADMPDGVDYEIVYDPTQFIRSSIEAVVVTLLEAIALVVLVVILFLQTWRASIIPLLAVPVSIIGTFAVMYALGFSINALSLFALVLAIGIVVDDAIVVVENVERNIEDGLSPRDATHRAMREVSGPIIAIAAVLVAVFVPLAFVSGLTGRFYNQFALTIAISTVISAINSLTLSPALSALLLKGRGEPDDALTRAMNRVFGGVFRGFNFVFGHGTRAYGGGVRRVLSRKARDDGHLPRPARRHVRRVQGGPRRLRARPGQAVPRRLRPAPRRRDPRPHRRRDPAHERHRDAASRRRERGRLSRPLDRRLHQQLQRRHRVRDARARSRSARARS